MLFEIYVDHSYFIATVYFSEELHLYQRICTIENESPKGHCSVNVTASAIPHLLAMHLRRWRNLEGGGQNLMLALSELKGAMKHNSVTGDPQSCLSFLFLKFCCKKSPLFKKLKKKKSLGVGCLLSIFIHVMEKLVLSSPPRQTRLLSVDSAPHCPH